MSAMLSRLLVHLPRGRRFGVAAAALSLVTTAMVVVPDAAHATTAVTVTVAGASNYGGPINFAATTNASGVTVTGVTCTTTTTGLAITNSLGAGNYTIKSATCSGGVLSDPNYTIDAYSGSFYLVYRAALTVTANDASRAYGAANPSFGYAITGYVNGDSPSAVVAGVPSITSTATNTSDVGTYPITPALGTLHTTSNYYFAFANGTLTVAAAPLTVTVAGASTYGGAPGFAETTPVSGVTATGVTCSGTTTSATISNLLTAGNYTIDASTCTGGTLSNPNYAIGGYKGSFYLVYRAPLTVTASDATRVYGAANPTFGYSVTGFVNGETTSLLSGKPTITTTATNTSDIGTYPINIAQGTLGSSSPNYYFSSFVGGTLTVAAAPVTVTVAGASVYGGAPGFAGTTNVSGVTVTGMTCTGTTSGDTLGTALNAGSYTIDATTCSGGTLSNPDFYIASYKASFFLVYHAPLTVTANDASRSYGAANPAFGYSVTGFVNGESASVVSGSPSFSTTATPTSDVGAYPITPALGTLKASNYYFTFATGTLTVNPAQVKVTVAGAQVYGTAAAFVASTPVSGLTVSGESCTGTTTSMTISPTLAGGTYTLDPSTCSGGVLSSTNYTIGSYAGGYYFVYRAPLTVTANDASRLYGAANPSFGYSITGFVNGDDASVVSGAPSFTTTATASSDVGTYPITPALGSLRASNYYFTFANGTLTVNPGPLKVNVTGAQVYGTASAFLANTSVSGVTVTGVSCTGVTGPQSIAPTLNAGTYTIDPTTCSGGALSSTNYYVGSYVGGYYFVYKAPLSVTPTSTSRVYGAANPAFDYTVTGYVNGDTSSSIVGAPTITSTATPSSDVGSYPISASLGSLKSINYYFTFASGSTLTITPATLTVTAQDASRAYGDADPTFGYSFTGFVNGDTSSVVSGAPSLSSTDTVASHPGTFPITASLGTLSATNYTFNFVDGTLTVVKATPVFTIGTGVSPVKVTMTYGSASTPMAGVQLNFFVGKTATVLTCTNGPNGAGGGPAPLTDSTGTTTCKTTLGQSTTILLSGWTVTYAGSADFNSLSVWKPPNV